MKKILLIQTAFIGDAILATALLENLHLEFPDAQIDLVVKKGNESLFNNHPFIRQVFVFDKSNGKFKSLISLIKEFRVQKYDLAINLHRFASSGLLLSLSGAKKTIGFSKNPLSILFSRTITHEIGNGKHEIERNFECIKHLSKLEIQKPKLYPSPQDEQKVNEYITGEFYCIAPSSVWFTKALPKEKWIELLDVVLKDKKVYILGAPSDAVLADLIIQQSQNKNVVSLTGKLSLLQSAALMKQAQMNYVNDSAPLHLCSATDAPVTAFFCSTSPAFGFGPLSTNSKILEVKNLSCKPCGLHGYKECPKKHFDCGYKMNLDINT